jgi:hypothetical protein
LRRDLIHETEWSCPRHDRERRMFSISMSSAFAAAT